MSDTRRFPAVPDRRHFLRTGAWGLGLAGAGLVVGCTDDRVGLGTPTAAQGPPSTLADPDAALGQSPATPFQLYADEDMNFEALFALGGAGLNAAAGEVVTAVNQSNAPAGGATYQSFYDAFVAQGNRLTAAARDAQERGRTITARDRYLRAAQYYDQALFFVLGTSTPDAEEDVYLTMDDAWTRAAELSGYERVEVPYDGSTLPAWFLPARDADGSLASGRRPTVIVNNGSDAQFVDTYAYGGLAATQRGYHALLFEGPGQGEMLFVRKEPFRPDWEQVIGPVVDALVERSDVDAGRIALTGWSFGGELVARAAAFEDRLVAVVSDPGSYDEYLGYPEFLRKIAEGTETEVNQAWNEGIVPGSTPEEKFTLRKRLEIYSREALEQARAGEVPTDWYGLSRRMQEYNVSDVASRISMPLLATSYQFEEFAPGQAPELARMVGDNAEVVDFTEVEGAQFHCAPMNPQWRNEVVFDWLAQHLDR